MVWLMVKFNTEKSEVIDLSNLGGMSSGYKLFRMAQFTARDLAISYRELNHWSEIGLIDDERGDNENGWRKFSLAGLVWVQIIRELRAIGVGIDVIERAKKSLFTPQADESALDMLGAIARCVSTQKPVFVVVAEDFAKIMLLNEFEQRLRQERQKPFVTIRLDQILSELMPELDWTIRDVNNSSDKLSKAETRALEVIRDGSFEQVTIIKENGKIDRLEKLTSHRKTFEIADLIKKVGFGKVNAVMKNGEIIFTEIKQVEKIND